MLPSKLAFVDTETTGLSVTRDRMIEIGIIRVENNKIVEKYQTLLDPGFIFSDIITSITGITPHALENAPSFHAVKKDIADLLKDCVLVAHNARFDYGFLKNEFRREEQTFSAKQLCTAKLSRALFPQERSHNLDSIIQRFAISCEKRHRAYDDAYVLWEFYQKLQQSVPQEQLEHIVEKLLHKPSTPIHIPQAMLDNLPELPGVYVFWGDNKTPLYVGKSVNMKERVLSHFSQDYTSSKEMHISSQVKDISVFPTSGELGALLKEALLIKKMQPLYNKKLRVSRKLVLAKKVTRSNDYIQVLLEEAVTIDPFHTDNIVGIFKSKRQAKEFLLMQCKKHSLCEKLLGLENGKGSCFGYRLDSCKGACVGKENPLSYNMRVIQAFSSNGIKQWPFGNAIAIVESDEIEGTKEYFVIDKWCVLGSFTQKSHMDLDGKEYSYSFDVDTYKILLSFLSKKDNWRDIYQLPLGSGSKHI